MGETNKDQDPDHDVETDHSLLDGETPCTDGTALAAVIAALVGKTKTTLAPEDRPTAPPPPTQGLLTLILWNLLASSGRAPRRPPLTSSRRGAEPLRRARRRPLTDTLRRAMIRALT